MCILIGGEAVRVSGTSIFARHCAPGRQLLVYSMRVFARTPTAMILPLPVVSGSGEHWYRRSHLDAGAELRCAASANTLDPEPRLHAMDVVGAHPNRDLWVG